MPFMNEYAKFFDIDRVDATQRSDTEVFILINLRQLTATAKQIV